jgi:hypothetical protein
VFVQLDGGRMPELEFRRVYDRAPAPWRHAPIVATGVDRS